ncbi:MAG TPA: S8 family serine peptidase, partial [Bdellovibrionales bacterium]|nr:S8 family serine peptidase [Bdellovibrionales bacterium]
MAHIFMYVSVLAVSKAGAQERHRNEVIVKLKSSISGQSFAQKLNGKPANSSTGTSFGKYKLKNSLTKLKMHKFEVAPGESVDDAVAELNADPDVEYAEPNYTLEKFEVEKSQTLSRDDLEGLVAAQGGTSPMSVTLSNIQTTEAWTAVTASSEKPVVAIIDSGTDLSHHALVDALWVNEDEIANNGVDDDRNGYVDDVNGWNFVNQSNNPYDGDGHGTHVAGIVRGVSQDLFAIPMGQPKIRIMTLKFLDDTGIGSTADAVAAIYYAV